jgi:hypothetical protein
MKRPPGYFRRAMGSLAEAAQTVQRAASDALSTDTEEEKAKKQREKKLTEERAARYLKNTEALRLAKASVTAKKRDLPPQSSVTGIHRTTPEQIVFSGTGDFGDMHQLPEGMRKAQMAAGEGLQLSGINDETGTKIHYFNADDKPRVTGTRQDIKNWFESREDYLMVINPTGDRDADDVHDVDNLTVEIGILDLTPDGLMPSVNLGGLASATTAAVTQIGTFAGGAVASALPGPSGLPPDISDGILAATESLLGRPEPKSKTGKTVLSRASVEANMRLKVEVYAGASANFFSTDKYSHQVIYGKQLLSLRLLHIDHQTCERYSVQFDALGADIDELIDEFFDKLEEAGEIG